jgi:hypothetical protein
MLGSYPANRLSTPSAPTTRLSRLLYPSFAADRLNRLTSVATTLPSVTPVSQNVSLGDAGHFATHVAMSSTLRWRRRRRTLHLTISW